MRPDSHPSSPACDCRFPSEFANSEGVKSAPARIRTWDQRFRKPLLYPLSYGCPKPRIPEAAGKRFPRRPTIFTRSPIRYQAPPRLATPPARPGHPRPVQGGLSRRLPLYLRRCPPQPVPLCGPLLDQVDPKRSFHLITGNVAGGKPAPGKATAIGDRLSITPVTFGPPLQRAARRCRHRPCQGDPGRVPGRFAPDRRDRTVGFAAEIPGLGKAPPARPQMKRGLPTGPPSSHIL